MIINIQDQNNHAPLFAQTQYQNTISEAAPVGTTVVKVEATDKDTGAGGQIVYNITDPTSTFKVGFDGSVILIRKLDYESVQSYNLTVTARDNGNMQSTNQANIFIQLVDVNDNMPVFDLKYYRAMVHENSSIGTSVLTVNARDNDRTRNSIRYSLVNNPDAQSFGLNSITGGLRLQRSLDYETQMTFTFNIEARDSANQKLFGYAHVIVTVGDVNDNKPIFKSGSSQNSGMSISVQENTNIGTLITVITASDKDAGLNGQITYKIQSGNEASKFVNENGHIRLVGDLDYLTQNKYILTIVATDRGTPSSSSAYVLTINILKYNESVPFFNPNYYMINIPENRPINDNPLITFGVMKTLPGSPISIHFHEATVFPEFRINGTSLYLAKELDFETTEYYDILVIAMDFERDMAVARVRINVQNLNEFTPRFTQSVYVGSVAEEAFIGHSVLSISATDTDGDLLYYSIVSQVPNDAFELSGRDVIVKSQITPRNYEFNVQVTDRTFKSTVSKVMVIVTKTSRPTFAQSAYIVSTSETAATGKVLLTLNAGDSATYVIESTEAKKMFSINSTGKFFFGVL